MTDILAADATDQLKALSEGTISARELLALSVARSRSVQERLNAVVNTDLETAEAVAGLVDAARSRGEALGVLAGLPMTVKDTFDVEGMAASGGGVAAFVGRDCKDAVVVARTKAAGAVIWGKTNSPVMAGDWQTYNGLYGTTNNPWDFERTPGGSSGGSAAMLAAQATALEIGSDIAGSLRTPASFCGVYAHKPTFGFLPEAGHVPPKPGTYAPSDLSVVGPMARSVRDLTLLLHVMSDGATPRTPQALDLKDLKIGLWLDEPAFILDAQVRATVEAYAADAAAAGVSLTPIESPVDGEELLETYNMLLMAYLAAGFPEHTRKKLARKRPAAIAKRRMGSDPLSRSATVLASTASHREWLLADEARWRMKAQMAQVFEQYDAIVAPVAPVEPFFHDHSPFNHRKLRCSNGNRIPYVAMKMWVALATTCGLPATAIPAGFSADGLPVGVQVIGPHGQDGRTLAIAEALDRAIGGFKAPDLGL